MANKQLSIQIKHIPEKGHNASFFGNSNNICYSTNGAFQIQSIKNSEILLTRNFEENTSDFWGYLDQANQVCGAFLHRSHIKIFDRASDSQYPIPKDYATHFYDKINQLIYFANKKDVFIFDLNKRSFETTSIRIKQPCEKFLIDGEYRVLLSEKAFQITNTETQMEYQSFVLSDKITCWDFKKNICGSSNVVLALGCENGETHIYKFKPNGQFESKRKKKWHAQSVLCLKLSQEKELLYSGGSEGVLVIWDYAVDKLDFLPRFGSPLLNIDISYQEEYFLVYTKNNKLFIKNNFDFASLYEKASVPDIYFESLADVNSSNFICFVDQTKRLYVSRYEVKHDDFEIKELNPLGRNFLQARSLNGLNGNGLYTIDKISISNDGNILATAESFLQDGRILFTKLKFFIAQQDKSTFELMSKFENPHLDDRIVSLHYIFDSLSNG